MRCKTMLLFLLIALFLAGCAPPRVQYPVPLEQNKPSLLFPPGPAILSSPKYPLRVGVMTIKDKRNVFFSHEADNYFAEGTVQAISDSLCRDLQFSGIFSEVIRIPEQPRETIAPEELHRIKQTYGVDMVLATYLTDFSMPREKTGASMYLNTYVVRIKGSMIGQLIYLDKGYVVWADRVERMQEDLTQQGVLPPEKMGSMARQVLQDCAADMKTLIVQTGKVMKVRQ